jgi:hypothetical protein
VVGGVCARVVCGKGACPGGAFARHVSVCLEGGYIKLPPRRGWLAICFLKYLNFVLSFLNIQKDMKKILMSVFLPASLQNTKQDIPCSLSSAAEYIYMLLGSCLLKDRLSSQPSNIQKR